MMKVALKAVNDHRKVCFMHAPKYYPDFHTICFTLESFLKKKIDCSAKCSIQVSLFTFYICRHVWRTQFNCLMHTLTIYKTAEQYITPRAKEFSFHRQRQRREFGLSSTLSASLSRLAKTSEICFPVFKSFSFFPSDYSISVIKFLPFPSILYHSYSLSQAKQQ